MYVCTHTLKHNRYHFLLIIIMSKPVVHNVRPATSRHVARRVQQEKWLF